MRDWKITIRLFAGARLMPDMLIYDCLQRHMRTLREATAKLLRITRPAFALQTQQPYIQTCNYCEYCQFQMCQLLWALTVQ